MPGKNIVELAANVEIDGTRAFEASFAPTGIHELLVEFEPKHAGPPIVKLSGDGGATEEVHPNPQRGREGRFSAQMKDHTKMWSRLSVTTARNMKARLVKVKLIGGAADDAAAPSVSAPPPPA